MTIRYWRTGPRISYVNRVAYEQRIIAITQVARGGPGKDYAAKLHDCGAITYRPPFSGLCSLLDEPPLTCGVVILMVAAVSPVDDVSGGGRAYDGTLCP